MPPAAIPEHGKPKSRWTWGWGLACSSATDVNPEIPSYAAHSEEVHPEVWLFNIYL